MRQTAGRDFRPHNNVGESRLVRLRSATGHRILWAVFPSLSATIQEIYEQIVRTLEPELKRFYGNRLVSVCLYGSVARGTMNNTSDLDVLVVARDLPRGRVKRIDEFRTVERALERILVRARKNVRKDLRRLAEISAWLRKNGSFRSTETSISFRLTNTRNLTELGPLGTQSWQ